jgi:hypothetical protein
MWISELEGERENKVSVGTSSILWIPLCYQEPVEREFQGKEGTSVLGRVWLIR